MAATTKPPPPPSAPRTRSSRISILIIGLETNDSTVLTMFKAGLKECQESQTDHDICLLNPANPDEARERLDHSLTQKKYDAVCVGFGLRGNRDFTPLFEQIVNKAARAQSQAQFAFVNWPNEIMVATRRALEQGKLDCS